MNIGPTYVSWDCLYNSLSLQKGDIDIDGDIDSDDLSLLTQYLSATLTPSNIQRFLADINGDGALTIRDLTALRRLIAAQDPDWIDDDPDWY